MRASLCAGVSSCIFVFACSSSDGGSSNDALGGTGGGASQPLPGSGGGVAAGGSSSPSSGGAVNAPGGGGQPSGIAGTPAAGGSGAGGVSPMGGAPSGGQGPGAGGGLAAGGAPPGNWPAADPAKKGPLATKEEDNVGPSNSYTLIRPAELTQAHPVVTWGNGTGTTPSVYSFLLTRLASHGFIVIASNSQNVAQGNPPPMLDGVTWVLAQNDDSSSAMYHHVDAAHIGATGHSQGGIATMSAAADPRITTIAPIEGFRPGQVHGPVLLLCGAADPTSPGIGCSAADSTFNGLNGVPVMDAALAGADHTNWISQSIQGGITGGNVSGFVTAVVGWMRVQLMGDQALKSMFYGADCTLCKDTANWTVKQNGM